MKANSFDLSEDVPTEEDAYCDIAVSAFDVLMPVDLTIDDLSPNSIDLDDWTLEDMEFNLEYKKAFGINKADFVWADERLNIFLQRMRLELKACNSLRKLNMLIAEMNAFDEALAEYTRKEYFANSYRTLEKIINRVRLVYTPKVIEPSVPVVPVPSKTVVTNIKMPGGNLVFPARMIHPTGGGTALAMDSNDAGRLKKRGYIFERL